jgi:recombination protein RecA
MEPANLRVSCVPVVLLRAFYVRHRQLRHGRGERRQKRSAGHTILPGGKPISPALDRRAPEKLKSIGEEKAKQETLLFYASRSPMSSKTAALRLHVESALGARVASPFEYRDRPLVEAVPAGIRSVDLLTGGFPRGSLTEIYGPPCSGRTSLLISALASRTSASEVCALVDARDAFDPISAEAAGVNLKNLLWVRCKNVDQALRAADLLIQGGGFGMIALDFGDTPAKMVRYVPLQVWFRFRRAVESTPTILVLLEQESNAKTCASLVLHLGVREARWSQSAASELEMAEKSLQPHAPGSLFEGAQIYAEMIRSRAKREGNRLIHPHEMFMGAGDSADFETHTAETRLRAAAGIHGLQGGPGKR